MVQNQRFISWAPMAWNQQGRDAACMKRVRLTAPRGWARESTAAGKVGQGWVHADSTKSSDLNFMRGRNPLMRLGSQQEHRDGILVTYLSRRPSVAPTLRKP